VAKGKSAVVTVDLGSKKFRGAGNIDGGIHARKVLSIPLTIAYQMPGTRRAKNIFFLKREALANAARGRTALIYRKKHIRPRTRKKHLDLSIAL
jgi:hypothetical protein